LLAFRPTRLGPVTSGTWSLYLDGSDVGLTGTSEDLDGSAVGPAGEIYLSTIGDFAVPGVSGANEDVFVFRPTLTGATTVGSYDAALFFDGSAVGLASLDLKALDVPVSGTAAAAVRSNVTRHGTRSILAQAPQALDARDIALALFASEARGLPAGSGTLARVLARHIDAAPMVRDPQSNAAIVRARDLVAGLQVGGLARSVELVDQFFAEWANADGDGRLKLSRLLD
jgi:hypothetical protein